MSLTRPVLVNDVQVELFDDTQPAPMAPMRVALRFIADSPYFVEDEQERREVCRRLREAGVEALPLYRREAEAAGIKWEEISESSAVAPPGHTTAESAPGLGGLSGRPGATTSERSDG